MKFNPAFQIHQAASPKDNSRYAISCVKMQGNKLIATDGHILAVVPCEQDSEKDQIHEQVLLVRPSTKQFETCKELAGKDGWHSFRVQVLDGSAPDFAKAVQA